MLLEMFRFITLNINRNEKVIIYAIYSVLYGGFC